MEIGKKIERKDMVLWIGKMRSIMECGRIIYNINWVHIFG